MIKLEYIDEVTFNTEEIEFSEEIYDIANKLYEQYQSESSKCTPIMVGNDKKSLVFCVNLGDREKDRISYEKGDTLYRVVIEKIIR